MSVRKDKLAMIFEKENKIIAISLLICGLISNGAGLLVNLFYRGHIIHNIPNVISSVFSLSLIIGLFLFFSKRNKYINYSKSIVLLTGFLTFPMILITSQEGTFFPYIFILAPSYGFLNDKDRRFMNFGVLNILFLTVIFIIKIKYNINITTDYLHDNFWHVILGLVSSFLYGLIMTTYISYNFFKLLKVVRMNSITDSLTGSYNRSYIDEIDFKNSCVIMLDIDHFKKLNDEYGHTNGDKSLIFLIDTIKKNIRKDDIIIRYGGEEFLIILKDAELHFAKKVAEYLRVVVMTLSRTEKEIARPFTISLGVSKYNSALSFEENIKIVDSCLYAAKNHGRNKVYSID